MGALLQLAADVARTRWPTRMRAHRFHASLDVGRRGALHSWTSGLVPGACASSQLVAKALFGIVASMPWQRTKTGAMLGGLLCQSRAAV